MSERVTSASPHLARPPRATLYDIPAPAKLNLFLHVTGRRADGYHLLQTVFDLVDLADTLHLERLPAGRIERGYELAGVAPEADLTVRAARALQAATGAREGVRITLEKRIPSGGGLGGGSSDAASVLIALNRLWGTGLDRSALMRLGEQLGADVPVFIHGGPAFAQGIGEQLQDVTLAPRAYVIIQPAASVPTAEIFGDPGLTRDSEIVTIADFSAVTQNQGAAAGAGRFFGRNDLAPVAYRRYPVVAQVASKLEASGFAVRMSGSGACLFIQFASLPQAVLAKQEIAATMLAVGAKATTPDMPPIVSVHACTGLQEHPLRHWVTR